MRSTIKGVVAMAVAMSTVATPAMASAGVPRGLPPRAYVVGTYDGSVLRLYVDGRLAAQQLLAGRVDAAPAALEIGSYLGGAHWAGNIGEVAVYDRAVSPAVARRRFRLGISTSPSAPAAYRASVLHSRGLRDLWPLNDPGTVAHPLFGRLEGRYAGKVGAVPRLLSGASATNYWAYFDGRTTSVRVAGFHAAVARDAFTLEAWVTAAKRGGVIVAVPGAFFLKVDELGRWGVGAFMHGRIHSVYSAFGARIPASASTPSPVRRKSGSSGGFSILWLLVIAVFVAIAFFLARRRRMPRSDAQRTAPESNTPSPGDLDVSSEPAAADPAPEHGPLQTSPPRP